MFDTFLNDSYDLYRLQNAVRLMAEKLSQILLPLDAEMSLQSVISIMGDIDNRKCEPATVATVAVNDDATVECAF